MIFRKTSLGERAFDAMNALFMMVLILITLYPFYYVVMASLSHPVVVVQNRGILLWPQGFTLEAYRAVLENPMIKIGYTNTLIYVTAGTFVNIILTSFGAYGLSRRNLFGKNLIMFMIVFTMFFGGGLIPTYLLVKNLGMLNTRWALIIPPAINTWNLIVMRTAFQSIPASLEESARMDGANDFTILFRIYLPLSLPVLSVMILFYAVSHWNAYFNAMIYLRDRTLYPLQLVLREILIASSTESMLGGVVQDREPIGETIKYATIVVATFPILCIYPFLQRYFVKGVMIGALKE